MRKLLIVIILLYAVPAMGTSIIPSNRHFIYKPASKWKFWKRNVSTFEVTAQAFNRKRYPVNVTAKCIGITMSESGKIIPSGEIFTVKPAESKLIPKELRDFEISFPIPKKNSGQLFVFIITPEPEETESNIKVILQEAWIGAVSFILSGEYDAVPQLSRDGDYLKVSNPSKYCIEGTLKFGDSDNGKHYFISAGKSRLFQIPDDSDHVVNDSSLLNTRQGFRF